MKKLILLLAILPYVFTACVEEDNLPQYLGEFKLGAEGEAYIKFEPGSYWIYENTKTKQLDTAVMKWYSSSMANFDGERRKYSREQIEFRWQTTRGEYRFSHGNVYEDLTWDSTWNKSVRHWGFALTGPSGIPSTVISTPPNLDFVGGGTSGQKVAINKIHDSLQVQNKWYYKVAEFELDSDPSYYTLYTDHTKYYWARNVGLVRRVLLEEHTTTEVESWDIIEYNVTP